MPVQPGDASLIEISLGGGLDETTSATNLPFDKMQICSNVVFADRQSCQQRQGITALTTISNGRKIVPHQNEVLVSDGLNLQSWNANQDGVTNRGQVSPCMVSRRLFASGNNKDQQVPNYNYPITPLGSVATDVTTQTCVQIWQDGTSVQASILDLSTGAYIQTGQVIAQTLFSGGPVATPQYQPRVAIYAGYAYVIYYDQNFAVLRYRSIQLAGVMNGWGAATSLAGTDPAISFDICTAVCQDSTQILALAYLHNNSGTYQAKVTFYNHTAGALIAVSTTVVTTVPATPTLITIATNTQNNVAVLIATSTSSTVHKLYYACNVAVNESTLNSVGSGNVANLLTGATTYRTVGLVDMQSGTGNSALWCVVASCDYTTTVSATTVTQKINTMVQYGTVSVDGTTTPLALSVTTPIGYQQLSKPFTFTTNGTVNVYCVLLWQEGQRYDNTRPASGAYQTVIICQIPISSGNSAGIPLPIAVVAPRFAGDAVPAFYDTSLYNNQIYAIGTETDVGGNTSLTQLVLDFQDPGLWQSVELGDWTWIAGGLPMIYDGNLLCEAGFTNQPLSPVVGLPAAGSVVIPQITDLTYCCVYTQQDVHGNLHQSPPSLVTIVDASAGYPSATLEIFPCVTTYRQPFTVGYQAGQQVQIEIYRNSSDAPAVLQLIATIENVQGQAASTFTDTVPDNSNATAKILYITGGGVPSDGPPNLYALVQHSDRVFGVSEDGQTSYFTTSFVRGECPRFTDAFTLTWPEGPLTAQWSIDGRFHAATDRDIWYTIGDGPADNGSGNDIQLPQLWQATQGVVDPRGLAVFPGGTLFWSPRGLYMEDRSGNFTWLGERIQREMGPGTSYPILTSITPLVDDGVIRFTAWNGLGFSGTAGNIIHWDYRRDKFSTHKTKQNGASADYCISSACINGVWYGLFPVGANPDSTTLSMEDSTTCLDNSTFVTSHLRTGNFHPEGMQANMRIHRLTVLGQQVTPAEINVTQYRDYTNVSDYVQTFTDADLNGLTQLQVQYTASPQKCEAISVDLSTSAPTTESVGIGQSIVWQNLQVRLRGKRGEFKQIPNNLRR